MPDANTLNRWSHEEVTVYIFWCLAMAKINTFIVLLLSFEVVWDLTFFDLWPLNHRSGEEVTVDTFWCLTPTNTLAVLVLPLKIVQNLTPFFDLFDLWPFFRRSDEEVTVDFFWCLTKINTLTVLLLSFHVVCDLTFLTFDPLTIGQVKRSPWTLFDVWPRPTLWQC